MFLVLFCDKNYANFAEYKRNILLDKKFEKV